MKKLKCNIGEYGVILKKNKILILRLPKNKEFKGLWMIPGGRLLENDEPGDGLLREIYEETGLKKVKINHPVYTARWGIERPRKYTVFYLCKLSEKKI